jgi:S1-C subfamily serine protease
MSDRPLAGHVLRALTLVGTGVLLTLCAIIVMRRRDEAAAPTPPQEQAPARTPREAALGPELEIREIVHRVLPSVVRIEALLEPRGQATGTGFAVKGSANIVATNRHVVEDAALVTVHLPDGRTVRPVAITLDEKLDLALLTLPGRAGLDGLPLRDDLPEQGEDVIAVGNPYGLSDTVTEGIISGVRKLPNGERVLQTSAAVSSGNSGGPLIDTRGRVVGIVTFKVVADDAESLNFAIPAASISALVARPPKAVHADDFYGAAGTPISSAGTAGTLEGLWRPHLGPRRLLALRSGGDRRIVVTSVTGSGHGPSPGPELLTLERASDGAAWEGVSVTTWQCTGWSSAVGGSRIERTCELPREYHLRLVRGRLEGRVDFKRVPNPNDADYDEACRTCLSADESVSKDEIWNREGDLPLGW